MLAAADMPSLLLHGTARKHYTGIYNAGLKAGGVWGSSYRQHIHLTTAFPGQRMISGMREDCELALHIDGKLAFEAGIVFYRSANGVILTEGQAGTLVCLFLRGVTLLAPNHNRLFLTDNGLLPAPLVVFREFAKLMRDGPQDRPAAYSSSQGSRSSAPGCSEHGDSRSVQNALAHPQPKRSKGATCHSLAHSTYMADKLLSVHKPLALARTEMTPWCWGLGLCALLCMLRLRATRRRKHCWLTTRIIKGVYRRRHHWDASPSCPLHIVPGLATKTPFWSLAPLGAHTHPRNRAHPDMSSFMSRPGPNSRGVPASHLYVVSHEEGDSKARVASVPMALAADRPICSKNPHDLSKPYGYHPTLHSVTSAPCSHSLSLPLLIQEMFARSNISADGSLCSKCVRHRVGSGDRSHRYPLLRLWVSLLVLFSLFSPTETACTHPSDHSATYQPLPGTLSVPPEHGVRKRSFLRACRRALRFGQTMYKGRPLRQNQVPSAITTPVIKSGTKHACNKGLRTFMWNCGGLGGGLYEELMVTWIDRILT